MKKFVWFTRLLAIGVLIFPLGAQALVDIGAVNALASGPGGTLVASNRGLFVASAAGKVVLRSEREGGFLALAVDPLNPRLLYASGRSGGLLQSRDAGQHWKPVGAGGPDSFQILVAGPKVLYGVADAIYQSTDGGKNWRRAGPTPDKLLTLTVAPDDDRRLYAGTMHGLMRSTDSAANWQAVAEGSAPKLPVAMVSANRDGGLFRFDWGRGLLRKKKTDFSWALVNNSFGGQAVRHLVRDGSFLLASTDLGKLFVSRDDGVAWQPLGGYPLPLTSAARRGEKLFAANCQACHGDHGIGQAPVVGSGQQSQAPALDETAHAWHHLDDQLVDTILHGLPAPSLMIGWAGRLKENDARDLVAYIKSLWTPRALSCQGPRHMDADCKS